MIKLKGCKPEPLAHYLKALGILRLVVEQGLDPKAKGHWQDNGFILVTNITEEQLFNFFLYDYAPTPIISPWNGGSGFYPKDNKTFIDVMSDSVHERFNDYRQSIKVICEILKELSIFEKPEGENKLNLVKKLREELSDRALSWLDSSACLMGDNLKFPPLLGSGGNDGRLEFSKGFLEQLQTVLDCTSGKPTAIASNLLKVSLFDDVISQLKFSGTSGQFNPWAGGGHNASPGFEGDSRTNPWDYILMLEGSMLFVAGVTRKHENQQGEFVYPFTVNASKAGYGSVISKKIRDDDPLGEKDRGELWIPLWSEPSALGELKILFSEGRVKVQQKSSSGKTPRTARDAVDFALALSQQGTRRGIDEFVRYGFLSRHGKMHLAVPLGRFQPKTNPQANLLGDIDRFREELRRVAQSKNCPSSIQKSYYQLDKTIIEFANQKKELLDVLISLGAVERALSKSRSFLWDENFSRYSIQPLYPLSPKWVTECDDKSVEFRLSLSLASRQMRQRLVYVRDGKWLPPTENDRVTTWQQGGLQKNLLMWLQREIIEENQQLKDRDAKAASIEAKPKRIEYFADLSDITQWILGNIDEERVEAIARGLSLTKIDWECKQQIGCANRADFDFIPIGYRILKLVHHRNIKSQEIELKKEPSLLPLLIAGDSIRATQLAIQRLKISGLPPLISNPIDDPQIERIAAALAFPINDYSINQLLRKFCQPLQENLEDK